MKKSERQISIIRNQIKTAIIQNLQERRVYQEPYIDRVERYMALWDTVLKLEEDIEINGIKYVTESGIVKKNESVGMLNQTNKQMDLMLEKLGISALNVTEVDESDL